MAMLIEPLALDQPIAGFNGGVYARPNLTVIESGRWRRAWRGIRMGVE
jgi:hypothetical protein